MQFLSSVPFSWGKNILLQHRKNNGSTDPASSVTGKSSSVYPVTSDYQHKVSHYNVFVYFCIVYYWTCLLTTNHI